MDEQTKIAHLLGRAGFGPRPDELDAALNKGLAATSDDLLHFDRVTDNLAVLDAKLDDKESPRTLSADLPNWWINAMASTTRPLQEKMVLFWHHLFATSADNIADFRQIYMQNQMFRGTYLNGISAHSDSFPAGSFRKILEDLAKDPAMLFFLDNWINVKVNQNTSSNENWGRELMELFSLGVRDVVTGDPNYTEDDVRQVARSFTGWSVKTYPADPFFKTFAFEPKDARDRITRPHDFGPYRLSSYFKNATGGTNADWTLDRIAERRSTARFISYRLFSFFGYDNPEPEIVEALADVYFANQYAIRGVLSAIFTPGAGLASEAFYSDKALKAKVKSPTEYVISSWRRLGGTIFTAQMARNASNSMPQMGQRLFYPPDVSGWHEGVEWINTTFDLARFNYANSLAILQGNQGGIAVEAILSAYNLQTAEQIVDHFFNRLTQRTPTYETRSNLIKYMYAKDDGTPGSFVLNQDTINKKVRGLLHLIMMTPDFQLN